MSGITYLTEDPILSGEICPTCGKKSCMVLRCKNCGHIFCDKCGNVHTFDAETENILARCSCGAETLFVG